MDANTGRPGRSRRDEAPADLAALTDEEILVRISQDNAEREIADQAATEFLRRHAKYLFGVCQMKYGTWFRSTDALEDLVQATFVRAYYRARTFRPGQHGDPNEQRWHVRGWLGTIARHLAVDMLRAGEDGRDVQPLDQDQLQRLSSDDGTAESSVSDQADDKAEMMRVVRDTITNVLSEKQREVLFARLEFYDPGNVHQRLPRDVLRALVARYGTSEADIRQEWKRAKEIIRQALLDSGFSNHV